ncbi:MAG TPA: hypothetical protein VIW03_16035, partial [Anaeromyxobacter sp.]
MAPTRTLAVLILCAAPALARADRNVVVLLPFDDLAARPSVARDLVGFAAHHVARRGWDVVYGEPVERVLQAYRIRYLDSLSAPVLARVLAELGADAALVGTLLSYRDGANGSVALSARLVAPGPAQVWTGISGLSAEDTAGMLGLGRARTADELVGAAARRLFEGFPDASRRAASQRLAKRRTPFPRPMSWRAPALDGRSARVCVLPFESFAPAREASRTLVDLASRRLGQGGGLRVVEAGALREAMLAEEVRTFLNADSGQLARLARRLDAPLFLRGTVYAYDDPEGGAGPGVDLQLTLVDVEKGSILWTSRVARRGTDYLALLQRGAISTAAALADQALAE